MKSLNHLHCVEIDRDIIARLHKTYSPAKLTVHGIDAPSATDSSPFADDSHRQAMAVTMKGAPDVVLRLCTHCQTLDDRVVPLHSHKFAARLQAAQGCTRPVLTRIETATGHGAGKASQTLADEWADVLAFAAHHTGLVPGE